MGSPVRRPVWERAGCFFVSQSCALMMHQSPGDSGCHPRNRSRGESEHASGYRCCCCYHSAATAAAPRSLAPTRQTSEGKLLSTCLPLRLGKREKEREQAVSSAAVDEGTPWHSPGLLHLWPISKVAAREKTIIVLKNAMMLFPPPASLISLILIMCKPH